MVRDFFKKGRITMSSKRAAIRRQRKEEQKAMKHKGQQGEMERAYINGIADGQIYATCIIFDVLHKKYKFRKKRFEKIISSIKEESKKGNTETSRFVMDFYQKKLGEKIEKTNIKIYVKTPKEKVYESQKINGFISASSLILMVLNQDFHFASKTSGKGRLDIVMEYAIVEFIKVQLDKENHNVAYYLKKLEEETGIVLE